MKIKATHIGQALLAVGFSAFLPVAASAATYSAPDYAGDTLKTAEVTTGFGTLDSITGSLAFTTIGSERTTQNPSQPALFAIDITGSTPFMATTLYQPGSDVFPGTLSDPVLYLFDSNGFGLYTDDDIPNGFGGASLLAPSSPLTPGLYYLGISTLGAIPRSGTGKSASSDIFPNPYDDPATADFTTTYGPTGPGGGSPLTNWTISSDDVEEGSFTIYLQGAAFAAVPEAPSGALLALGLIPLAFLARRKKANAPA